MTIKAEENSMQRRTNMLSTIVLSAAMCFGASAIAADTATSGTDSYITYQMLSGWNSLKMGSTEFATYELNGVSSSSNGMFDHLGMHCLGEVMGPGEHSGHWRGACTAAGKDGDQFSWTYDGSYTGHVELTGGTGRYKGITGIADYAATGVQGPEGHNGAVVNYKIQWKIQ
jgi:hypothetical protein